MSKKNQSKVSTVADCFRGCFDCQCRRRTIFNKILPAVVQIFIVIAVWTILKAQMMPDESSALAEAQAQAEERYIRSAAQFERDHNCSMGDYMRGNVLHVDGMLSQARVVSPDSNQRRPHFLSVDVLIRDVEEGTMVLYPVGTPVNFGSLNIFYPDEEDEDEDDPLNGTEGNGTHVQFDHPDDVATTLDVESIEGHLVPEQQFQAGMPGYPGQAGALGQGPLGAALYPGQIQPGFPNDPSSWQKQASPLGPGYPNPAFPASPHSLYPNPALPRAGGQLPLSLGDMGLSPYGSSLHSGVAHHSAYGAAHGPTGPGIAAPGMVAPGMAGPGVGVPGLSGPGLGVPGMGVPANPGGDALNHNLVLTRKPDGGYSLRFKPGGDEGGAGPGPGAGAAGPGAGAGPLAPGTGRVSLNLGGHSWQPPTGPADSVASRKFGMHSGPSRFPFGHSTSGQPGQAEPGQSGQAGQTGQGSQMGLGGQSVQPEQPQQSSAAEDPAGTTSSPVTTPATEVAGSDTETTTALPTILKQSEGDDAASNSDTKPNTPEDDTTKPGNEDEKEKPEGDNKEETTTPGDITDGSKTSEEESVDKPPVPLSDGAPSGSDSGDKALLGEGFEERLKKFKTELFGKDQDDKGDDGTLTGNFKMNNPEICQKSDTIDVLYVIASKPQSMDVRNRIRQGYVSPTVFENVKMEHVFVVGKTNSPNFQKNLDSEKERFNDVAMGEYLDAPENATLKAVSGMRWVKQFCPQAKHIMYVDESFFVDTDKLVKGLIPTADKVSEPKYILCPFMPSMPIPRQGPNAVKKPLFPTSTHFRPYCKGYAVLMSRPAMLSLLAASEQTPMFPAPDIYLFGILPYIVGDMEIYDVGSKRAFHDFGQEVVACYEEKKDRCPLVASKASSSRFEKLLNLVKTRMTTSHDGWEGDNTVWDLKSFKRII